MTKFAGEVATRLVVMIAAMLGAYSLRTAYGADRELAGRILDAANVQGGLIVHVGCGQGRLTAALHASEGCLVHGLDADADEIAQARSHIRSLGLYGAVSVEHWSGGRLPYTDNLVNLVVSEDLGEVSMDEVVRVLRPGGAAHIKSGGQWMKTVKPRPKEIDDWTHFLHDSDNNAVAEDSMVGPPRHIQWVGGPKWARSHEHLASVSAMVSAGGRIFSIVDEGPTAFVALPAKWRLVARDAFNGVVLWKRPVSPWEEHLREFRNGPPELPRRLVAVSGRVYATLGYGKPVSALDAATGETAATYEGTEGALEILHHDRALFLVAGDIVPLEAAEFARRRGVGPPPSNKRVLAIKAETGELLWRKADSDTAELLPLTLAVSNGRLFFQNPNHLVCLDAQSGRECWRADRPASLARPAWSAPTLVVHGDIVLSADRRPSLEAPPETTGATDETWKWFQEEKWKIYLSGAPGSVVAFSAKTGERLWSCPGAETFHAPVDVLAAGGLVWTGNLVWGTEPGVTAGRDPATGEVKRQRPADQEFFRVIGHHRCHRNRATNRYLVLGRSGVEWIDLVTGRGVADHWVRGECQFGVLPCNGLLYAPSHSCACYIEAKLNGFNALAPKRGPSPAREKGQDERRLERGPAYGAISLSGAAGQADWPTYRHDAARSGGTKSVVPANLRPRWRAKLGGKLSSVVVAEGKVLAAEIDAHTIHALDAVSGERLWSYTVGGRVDSPPTLHKGLVVFGSADGRVYCLRASDGELAWRFRAAPEDRRVVAYGQLESAWPVHGSVLVQNDTAYFAAGRSSFLDGGVYLYRLDLATGGQLSQTCVNSRDPKTGEEPQKGIRGADALGALPDVLSSDGSSVHMRHTRFDLQGVEQEANSPHLFSPQGFLDDSWWHRSYWLIGTRVGSGYGRWMEAAQQSPAGRLLVFDASSVYGFGQDHYVRHGSHVGIDPKTVFYFGPDRNDAALVPHYRLFSMSREDGSAGRRREPQRAKRAGGKGQAGAEPAVKNYRWTRAVPFLVRAMVLADKTLFLAGPPDEANPQDLSAALEGQRGGSLQAVSAENGNTLAEHRLDSPPVFDGLAAADGRLYMAAQDGQVLCLGKVD